MQEYIDNLFSKDKYIVDKLKELTAKVDYKKLFFETLGPGLKKIFINKKDKPYLKFFFEALQYEYGFFNKKFNLQKSFSLYKKYADLGDYYCMYKMHLIYLCDYKKFNVPLNRVLEKYYLLKCLAYIPNKYIQLELQLFKKIDIIKEIDEAIDLEDENLEKHKKYFDLLIQKKEKYNLTENDINLVRGVFFCIYNTSEDSKKLSFKTLNSILPKNEFDIAYYQAKNKCIFFKELDSDNTITNLDIKNFYKDIEEKKLFEFYIDYGDYLIELNDKINPEIINILKISADRGNPYVNLIIFLCLLNYYDFDLIMKDYDKASTLLDHLLLEIVEFDDYSFGFFIILMGHLIKNSIFSSKIISKYLIYVKEINDFINAQLNKKDNNSELIDKGCLFYSKANIYYFGFEGIVKQNYQKALEFYEKAVNTDIDYIIKNSKLMIYNIKKIIKSNDLNETKKDLINYIWKNLDLNNIILDCFVIAKDYLEEVIVKKDEAVGILLFKHALNSIICNFLEDLIIKEEIKKFLKSRDDISNIDIQYKNETCCICYEQKVNKIFIPCKHNFCSECAIKLGKDKKCPLCREKVIAEV